MAEIVEGLSRNFASEKNLSYPNKDMLFEAFVSYCVLGEQFPDVEVDEVRMGGPGDQGIDGFAAIINDEVYTNSQDVKAAVTDSAHLDVHFVLIQAKNSRKFEGPVFSRLGDDIAFMFSDKPLSAAASTEAHNVRDCIAAICNSNNVGKFKKRGRPTITAVYASRGSYRHATHKAAVQRAVSALDATEMFRHIELQVLGAEELRYLYRRANMTTEVNFNLTKYLELRPMPSVDKAVLGTIRAKELVANVLMDDKGSRRPWLFDENLRDYLGKNPVNARIQESLDDTVRSHQFAVLNNGVTIVTRKMTQAKNAFALQDPMVVNGCQTCNVLYENRESLTDDTLVSVRLIQSTDEEFISSIVDSTNRQNTVKTDEYLARERFQRHIEDFFNTQSEPKIRFERRTRQFGTSVRARTISRRHLTQAYAAMWLDVPHKVSRYQSLIETYKADLYQPSHDPLLYYASAVAYERLNSLFAKGLGAYRPVRFQLLMGIRLTLLGDLKWPRSVDEIQDGCKAIIRAMRPPSAAQPLVDALVSAVHTALGSSTGLSGLGAFARSEDFTVRFKQAVLTQRGTDQLAA